MAKKKSKIIVADVMKVIDVPVNCINPATVKFLRDYFLSYTDNEGLKEDLLRITMDQDELDEFYACFSDSEISIVKSEIEELKEIAVTKDAAYIRFISF